MSATIDSLLLEHDGFTGASPNKGGGGLRKVVLKGIPQKLFGTQREASSSIY